MNKEIQAILEQYHSDKTRLMDMLWDVQNQQDYICDEAVTSLAEGLNMSVDDVRETLSFYHFFKDRPFGKYKVYLCNTVIAKMGNYEQVRTALEQAVGTTFGSVDASGTFGLGDANCIGLSDQEPAMMVEFRKFVETCLQNRFVVPVSLKHDFAFGADVFCHDSIHIGSIFTLGAIRISNLNGSLALL
jgi:NADH:ubiquinone oxidoreductase subunit E